MPYEPKTPFDTIEGALEYVSLLADSVEEARGDIAVEHEQARKDSDGTRRADALRLVAYKLDRLAEHAHASRRLLNDLRTLRRLLLDERGTRPAPATQAEDELELDG